MQIVRVADYDRSRIVRIKDLVRIRRFTDSFCRPHLDEPSLFKNGVQSTGTVTRSSCWIGRIGRHATAIDRSEFVKIDRTDEVPHPHEGSVPRCHPSDPKRFVGV